MAIAMGGKAKQEVALDRLSGKNFNTKDTKYDSEPFVSLLFLRVLRVKVFAEPQSETKGPYRQSMYRRKSSSLMIRASLSRTLSASKTIRFSG
jgi:hypothetical protein